MIQFEYWAIGPDGTTKRGIESGPDKDVVLRKLIKQKLVPLDIKKATDSQKRLEHLKQFREKLEPPREDLPSPPKEVPNIPKPAVHQPKDHSTTVVMVIMVLLLIGALFHRALSI